MKSRCDAFVQVAPKAIKRARPSPVDMFKNSILVHTIFFLAFPGILEWFSKYNALSHQGANNTPVLTRMRRKCKAIHKHSQIFLPSHLWVLFYVLLISISPNSCSGAYANASCQHNLILNVNIKLILRLCAIFSSNHQQ